MVRIRRLDREFRELIAVLGEYQMTEGLDLTDVVTSTEGWGPAAPPDPPALR
jgi:hypothetical protein